MLEGLLHHKKEEKDYLSALVVGEDRIDAALWEATKDGKVTVLKTSFATYSGLPTQVGDWDKAIDAADKAITDIESGLPEGVELTKVVFGLFPDWVSDDRIKETYLKQLRQLTTALSLTALGFVELPQAVVHQLHKDEGTQQTVILVGVETKHINVSLFKIGKLSGSKTFERSESFTQDVEQALASFTDVEVLPSRILLYGTSPDLEKLKTDMLNHPWQKKANFLHFPKIDLLPPDFAVKAVAIASSTEIIPSAQETEGEAEGVGEETAVADTTPVATAVADHKISDVGITKDEGFSNDTAVTAETAVSESNVVPVELPKSRTAEDGTLARARPGAKQFFETIRARLSGFTIPKFDLTLRAPTVGMKSLLVVAVVVLVLLGASAYGAYWLLPKATVKLLVYPQTLDKNETITVDPAAGSADAERKILPGKTVSVELTGSKSIPTTGKKTVGDKAKGEVTIYNKTLNAKTFAKGTILGAGKLKFSLDGEAQIASASEGVGSLTYGTTKVKVTAEQIGTESNLAPGTEFSFSELPTTSYSARNEQSLAGGTSREIAVVTRDDQKKARDQAIVDLKDQAEEKLKSQLSPSEKVFGDAISTKISQELFNKEIGEEADELKIDLTLTATTFAYNEQDFYALLDKIVADSVPQNYEYKKEGVKLSVTESEDKEGDGKIFNSKITVELLPKLETADLTSRLAGRSVSEATDYLRSQPGVSGVEFSFQVPFGFLKSALPANPKNIAIEVSTVQ